jgi:hypothetical protein
MLHTSLCFCTASAFLRAIFVSRTSGAREFLGALRPGRLEGVPLDLAPFVGGADSEILAALRSCRRCLFAARRSLLGICSLAVYTSIRIDSV